MATGGEEKVGYSLANVGTLTLESINDTSTYSNIILKSPYYISIVVCQDKIIVIDISAWKVQLHRLHDGKFLATSDRLESKPRAMCLMGGMEVCVLHGDGLIKMMSIDSTDMSHVFTTTRGLRLQGVFNEYHGVVRFKDNLVVSGFKQHTLYWCIVSLHDGHVDALHRICKGYGIWSSVTTKDNMIYISCIAGYTPNIGVYGFDILNPNQCKYTYKHQYLQWPAAMAIHDDGNIFVCNNGDYPCIHQITASCQLVAIFTQGIPWDPVAMFWDDGRLYGTCYGSDDIIVFQPVYQAPLTSKAVEREHFSRISCLIVDIGTKVLRCLLTFYTVTPNCTFAQFLKNNAKVIRDLRNNKIFSSPQLEEIFPKQGTRDHRKYDISLTSALLLNLVPNIDLQVDQAIRDVRSDINLYQAHTSSARMKSSDFTTHWKRITGNLIYLSKCCCDPDFEDEIIEEIKVIENSGQQDLQSRINKREQNIQILYSRVDDSANRYRE